MKKILTLLVFWFFGLPYVTFAQVPDSYDPLTVAAMEFLQNVPKYEVDSSRQLRLLDFHAIVAAHHPVISQARALDEIARQELRFARGFFDPKVDLYFDNKQFNETTYWNIFNSSLSIPLWSNTDLKVGYERNFGTYLNSDLTVPEEGLMYAGISIPIGQGLVIDKRRAVVRQAQIFQDFAEAEKINQINRLMLNATRDFLDFYLAFSRFMLMREARDLASFRFEAIKTDVINGDAAPIDSVEAFIFYQDRDLDFQQAQLQLDNSRLILSNHFWSEDGGPLELEPGVVPVVEREILEELVGSDLSLLLDDALQNHPELRKIENSLLDLQVEMRLAREMLKPTLNINYNFLNSGLMLRNVEVPSQFMNDYKFGTYFSFPIFLRKERAKRDLTGVKIYQTELDRKQVGREISNRIQANYNNIINNRQQMEVQSAMVSNHLRLVNAERIRFENGESSLFLINTREVALINAQDRLLRLDYRLLLNHIELLWSAGLPYLGNAYLNTEPSP